MEGRNGRLLFSESGKSQKKPNRFLFGRAEWESPKPLNFTVVLNFGSQKSGLSTAVNKGSRSRLVYSGFTRDRSGTTMASSTT